MKYVLIIALPLLALVAVSPAQITWERVYGDSRSEANDVIQTSDGGYLVVGVTDMEYSSSWLVSCNAYFIKTDEHGEIMWTKTYGDSVLNVANSALEVDGNGYIVSGYRTLPQGVWIIRLNESGDTLWTKTFEGVIMEGGHQIIDISGEGYMTIGYRLGLGIWYLRLNEYGTDTIWTRTYTGGGVVSITEAVDGDYISVGLRPVDDNNHIYAERMTSDGERIWNLWYDRFFEEGDAGRAIVATPDNGAIIGFSGSMIDMDYSPSGGLIKIDSLGEIVWRRNFHPASFPLCVRDVAPTNDGNYIIAGDESSDHIIEYELAKLAKYSESGGQYWNQTHYYDDWLMHYNRFSAVTATDDGGYIAVGACSAYEIGLWAIYLVKTDSLGEVSWVSEIPIKPNNIEILAYPNPFNSSCKITIDGVGAYRNTPLQIEIYDLRGNVVAPSSVFPTGSESHLLPAGEGKNPLPLGEGGSSQTSRVRAFTWTPAQSISSGIYLVRATMGEQTITKQILYLR